MEENGEEIILMGDFNQHIYAGKLQEAFTVEDIGPEEQFRKLYAEDAPFSHTIGSTRICVFFNIGYKLQSSLDLKS